MRIRPYILSVLSVAILAAPMAFAANNTYQGAFCQPTNPADVSKVGYSQWGIHNFSAVSPASVDCPAAPTTGSDILSTQLVVFDRNAASNVCCTIQIQNATGVIIASAVRCSAGSSGSAQTLPAYVPPFNVVGTVNLACTIPPFTATGASHVTSYRIQSNP